MPFLSLWALRFFRGVDPSDSEELTSAAAFLISSAEIRQALLKNNCNRMDQKGPFSMVSSRFQSCAVRDLFRMKSWSSLSSSRSRALLAAGADGCDADCVLELALLAGRLTARGRGRGGIV